MAEEQKDEIRGSVDRIRASITCGGCGAKWDIDLDPARQFPQGWSLFDEVVDDVRGLGHTSVQGGYLLCEECTKKVDLSPLIPVDRSGTAEEVARVLKLVELESDDETDDEEDEEGDSDDEQDEENEHEVRKVDENGQ